MHHLLRGRLHNDRDQTMTTIIIIYLKVVRIAKALTTLELLFVITQIFNITLFSVLQTKNSFDVQTAFAPATATNYVRIIMFLVCGASSRVLSQPWRQYQIIAAAAAPPNSYFFS